MAVVDSHVPNTTAFAEGKMEDGMQQEPKTPATPPTKPQKQPMILSKNDNDGAGDCLFYSVAMSLQNYHGKNRGLLEERLIALDLDLKTLTATDLRTLVYSLFLLPFEETDEIMTRWQVMVQADATLAIEYGQAVAIKDVRIDTMKQEDRFRFFGKCMDRTVTWGDEFALFFIERLLKIRCLVITRSKLQSRQYGGHGQNFRPIIFVPIDLAGSHYQAISWPYMDQEHWAFAEDELPDVILRLAHRDCRNPSITAPYIRLDHIALQTPLSDEKAMKERGTTDQSARPRVPDIDEPDTFAVLFEHWRKCKELVKPALQYVAEHKPTLRCGVDAAAGSRRSQLSAAMMHAAMTSGSFPPGISSAFMTTTQPALKEFDIEGGEVLYPGKMGDRVFRLQCGLRVPKTFSQSPPSPPPATRIRDRPFPTVVAGRYPCVMFP